MSEHSEATPPRAKEAGPRTEIIQTQSAPAAGNGKPGLPAVIPQPEERPRRRVWAWVIGVLLILAAGGSGGYYWWQQSLAKLPDGIAWSNGRIERDEIDIDTKFAGRVSEILVKEGDIVKAGQPVARMQSDDLKASLDRAEDQVSQAQHAVDEASAARDQQQTLVNLAKQQLDRTKELISRGNATRELLDQRQQQFDAASAALGMAKARVSEATYGLKAAEHQAEIYKVNIADNTLVAPRDGRIQYRIANVGEVLPAGGRVFTMLDLSSVYMDVFLPTLEAGKVAVGSEARIVLDAYPDDPIPATVSFVASQAQFTPKTVETKSERDKLMFRVRIRVDPDMSRARADKIQSGLPGIGYVRLDPSVAWPARLQPQAQE